MEFGNQLLSKLTSSLIQPDGTTIIISTLVTIVSCKLLYSYLTTSSQIKDISERKKVVIVGGGFAGMAVAVELDSKFDVTVIERNQTFFHCFASLRCAVEPDFATKSFFGYEKALKYGKVVHGTVSQVTPHNVLLTDNQEFTFDYLVIATGTNNITPFKSVPDSSRAIQYYRTIRDKIASATKILIVGGGPSGVELAGEIVTDFKGKDVTLISRSNKLISSEAGDVFIKKLNEKLEKLSVKVMLNTSIEVPAEVLVARRKQTYFDYKVEMKTYHTDKGEIEADLVFWTVGNKNNSETLGAFPLNEVGQIKVEETFQVEGFTNIFAVGDITNTQEMKTWTNAQKQIPIIVNNIIALSKKNTKLSTYQPSDFMVSVSLGKYDGIGALNSMVLPTFMIKYLKSKTMQVEQSYKLLGKPETSKVGQQ